MSGLKMTDAYKEVYKTEEGRRVIDDIINTCGVHSPNNALSGIVEGKRQIGLYIINMLKENANE